MKKIGFGKIACILSVFCVAALVASPAQTFSTLRAFNGTNGWRAGSLVQGLDGNFYGTTQWGGAYIHERGATDPGDGTVFEITPEGELRTLYNFCSQSNSNESCIDGQTPNGLILAANGNFYGTTFAGGTGGNLGAILQVGTVFEMTPGGTLTTLYSFCTQFSGGLCLDGSNPTAGLVQGVNGNFYGTTQGGGTGSGIAGGGGTIFEITAAGKLTTLYNFCSQTNCTDGATPSAALVLGTDGNFYGTTSQGGTNVNNPDCPSGCGTIFKFTPGHELTTLYNFCSTSSCIDGYKPAAALVQGSDGALYGTVTSGGDTSSEAGLIFRITPGGQISLVYSFCAQSGCPDGAYPYAGLTLGSDGNFYGTASGGGANDFGTAFEFSTAGALTTLYSFCPQTNCPDGEYPVAELMQSTNGTFNGSASAGGNLAPCDNSGERGCGTVFNLATGLGPFVEANPRFGKSGYKVNILGNNLTGATSVTFNGTAATFTVVSPTLIKATVPTGATTGTIQVTTPSRTLSSNVAFQVLP
jgi:uncharacterized repeat protein (TIGR03803 family)